VRKIKPFALVFGLFQEDSPSVLSLGFWNAILSYNSKEFSLFPLCIGAYCPGDVHWARLEASALGGLCCLPRIEGRKKGRKDGPYRRAAVLGLNKNLAIANRSRVSCAHNSSRASL